MMSRKLCTKKSVEKQGKVPVPKDVAISQCTDTYPNVYILPVIKILPKFDMFDLKLEPDETKEKMILLCFLMSNGPNKIFYTEIIHHSLNLARFLTLPQRDSLPSNCSSSTTANPVAASLMP